STILAGQKLGIREVDDDIRLVAFMHYDRGYVDLEQRTLQTLENPFRTPEAVPGGVTHVLGTICYPCVPVGPCSDIGNLERPIRIELRTPTLARLCSTPELRPLGNS